jgi:hypothetical protein
VRVGRLGVVTFRVPRSKTSGVRSCCIDNRVRYALNSEIRRSRSSRHQVRTRSTCTLYHAVIGAGANFHEGADISGRTLHRDRMVVPVTARHLELESRGVMVRRERIIQLEYVQFDFRIGQHVASPIHGVRKWRTHHRSHASGRNFAHGTQPEWVREVDRVGTGVPIQIQPPASPIGSCCVDRLVHTRCRRAPSTA